MLHELACMTEGEEWPEEGIKVLQVETVGDLRWHLATRIIFEYGGKIWGYAWMKAKTEPNEHDYERLGVPLEYEAKSTKTVYGPKVVSLDGDV